MPLLVQAVNLIDLCIGGRPSPTKLGTAYMATIYVYTCVFLKVKYVYGLYADFVSALFLFFSDSLGIVIVL